MENPDLLCIQQLLLCINKPEKSILVIEYSKEFLKNLFWFSFLGLHSPVLIPECKFAFNAEINDS